MRSLWHVVVALAFFFVAVQLSMQASYVGGFVHFIAAVGPLAILLAVTQWRTVWEPGAEGLVAMSECDECRYDFAGLPERGVCPECGAAYAPRPGPPSRARTVGIYRPAFAWRIAVATAIVCPLGPLFAPLALAYQYSQVEPFAAAWSNATLRPWNAGLHIYFAAHFFPMCVLATIVARGFRSIVFPFMVAAGFLGGVASMFTVTHDRLAGVIAWPIRGQSNVEIVMFSCAGVIAIFAVAVPFARLRRVQD